MTLYETIITCVAAVNIVLTLHNMKMGQSKAAAAKLDELETSLREQLRRHESELNRLVAHDERALTHEHLDGVYEDLRSIAQQVHQLVGQQQQMNENLRLLLARLVRE